MSNGNGHRWSKFWWRDHQGDAALRMCSLAARGFWMELLCLAHEAIPAGHVLVNGKPPSVAQIAAIAGTTPYIAQKLIAELESAGVFSRTVDGVIFCRRMIRDAAASEQGRENVNKRYQGHNPDPPSRGATREATSRPNGEATSDPTGRAYRPPGSGPTTLYSEAESEAEPPRGPPVTGGAARRGKSRNPFHAMARRMDAELAGRGVTIEGAAENVENFDAWLLRLRDGSNG